MATPQTSPPVTTPVLPRPLFSLDTITPSEHILVNGQPYDLLKMDQVSIAAFHQLQLLCPRFDALMAATTLTEDEAMELSGLLVRIVRLVLQAPEDVLTRLTDNQRLQVVLAFIGLSSLSPTMTRATTTQATTLKANGSQSTGGKRSPASAASTPARRRRRG